MMSRSMSAPVKSSALPVLPAMVSQKLLEAIAGIRKPYSGEIWVDGQKVDRPDPAILRKLGLAHIPEDRHHMGLVLKFEEYENSILGYHHDERYGKGPFLNPEAIRKDAVEKIEKYDIRPPNPQLKTANFSGGNQQKIVVAREIERDPKMLIIGQPTRGVDIGAIEFIHRRIIEMRDAGKRSCWFRSNSMKFVPFRTGSWSCSRAVSLEKNGGSRRTDAGPDDGRYRRMRHE